jgi:hypothetical protein
VSTTADRDKFEPPDREIPPTSAYFNEPVARGMRRERGPDVPAPRQPQAPWHWKPTRALGAVLVDVVAFLEAEQRRDANSASGAPLEAHEERAA